MNRIRFWYSKHFISKKYLPVSLFIVIFALLLSQVPRFRIDASGDSLVLENDLALHEYEGYNLTYDSQDFLIVTFQPQGDLFADSELRKLELLRNDLKAIPGIESVLTILDVPLFQSPPVPLLLLATGYQTLLLPTCDRQAARRELLSSPIYAENLISRDGSLTALQLVLRDDSELKKLRVERHELKSRRIKGTWNDTDQRRWAQLEAEYSLAHANELEQDRQVVTQIRTVLDQHRSHSQLFLGGLPMIVNDIIAFVKRDIYLFGSGVTLFLILTLFLLFRRLRWVLLPMACCLLAAFGMLGLLGLLDWPGTVISSNFVSLLLIITMSLAIHLIVRYRELASTRPELDPAGLSLAMASEVAVPALYCALTTMVGFGSLVVSGIRPVIDFGLMMSMGIALAFLIVFTLIPWFLARLPKLVEPIQEPKTQALTRAFAEFTQRHCRKIPLIAVVLLGFFTIGIYNLSVENRFIDYFRRDTEINRGLSLLDAQLGGTTPLEIVLKGQGPDDWFRLDNLAKLRKLHQYLATRPEVGKVLSLDSMIQVAENVNKAPVNAFLLGLIRMALPEDMRARLLSPYSNSDFSETKVIIRIRETGGRIDRERFLSELQTFITRELEIPSENQSYTGMYILYNNMLNSLFRSQIQTMGSVFLAILLMFWLLFRSLKLAIISVLPNLLPAVAVLGLMGSLGISLDMMTITIAAISIGIAVDHTIHYVVHFRRSFALTGNYAESMYACHAGIGRALYDVSLTIIIGFSILAFSEFLPTIYFGLFTGLAMLVALFTSLTLLPSLLLVLKPLGAETR